MEVIRGKGIDSRHEALSERAGEQALTLCMDSGSKSKESNSSPQADDLHAEGLYTKGTDAKRKNIYICIRTYLYNNNKMAR